MADAESETEAIGLGMAIGFAALAGAVDACGLMRLHDRFVSFMSGNTTTLGVAVGRGELTSAAGIVPLILWFVVGAALGAALPILTKLRPLPVVASAVAALLILPLIDPGGSVPAMAVAMGALNAAMHRAGPVPVSLTYVTGALVKFGQGVGRLGVGRLGVGRLLCGRRARWSWALQAVPWIGMLAGGIAAGWMQARFGAGLFWPVSLYAVGLAVIAWRVTQPDAAQGTTV